MKNVIDNLEEIKKVETVILITETQLEYVTRQFSKSQGESTVKYCPVGNNRFRVNFYTNRRPNGLFPDYIINRSYYVIITKNGNSWNHTSTND